MTNTQKVLEEDIRAVQEATPESLQKPTVIAAKYFPEVVPGQGMQIQLVWLEDHPTLRTIKVRNPETEMEVTLSIPQADLDDVAKHDELTHITYRWMDFIPADFVDSGSQVLEVSPGNGSSRLLSFGSFERHMPGPVPTTQP